MPEEKQVQKTQPKGMTLKEYTEKLPKTVLEEIEDRKRQGLVIPPNYAVGNALASAIMILQQTLDKNKQPVLLTCTPESVRQALVEMITHGLSPSKQQCYFIAYGNKLTLFESYFGIQQRAKATDPNIKNIFAEVVYEKDKFKYVLEQGHKKIVLHEQEPENVDINAIKGAYATIVYKDGPEVSEYMSWPQIKKSWERSTSISSKDVDPHINQPDLMAKRTVLRRLCRTVVNTSDDSQLLLGNVCGYDDEEEEEKVLIEQETMEAERTIDITPEPETKEEPEQVIPEQKIQEQKQKDKPKASQKQANFFDDDELPEILR